MRAAVLKNKQFIIEEIEKPELNSGEGAVIKVNGCGLCGSDLVKMFTGKAKDGDVLGHEVVGEIVDINSKTEFKRSDRVALGHHIPCFKCQYCLNENYSMCRHFKSTNIKPGGFSEFIYVTEEHLLNTVFKVNDDITDVEASYMEPLACCLRAVKRANLKQYNKSLIIGLGSVGMLMGAAVNALSKDAYGCDIKKERVELSEKYGFKKSFILEEAEKTLTEMRKTAPEGFDVIFLTAGASSAVDFALKTVRDGGKIVVFSSIKNNNSFLNNDIYYRELTVMGSYSPSPNDLKESLNLISTGKVNVKQLSTLYSLDKLNEAVSDTQSNKIMKAYIQI